MRFGIQLIHQIQYNMALTQQEKNIIQQGAQKGWSKEKTKRAVLMSRGETAGTTQSFKETEQPELTREQMAQGGADTQLRDVPANVLSSGGRAIGDIASMVTKPKQTIQGIGRAIGGAARTAGESLGIVRDDKDTASEQAFDQIKQFYKDRYGSLENLKQTAINDPIGVGLDIATLFTGAGGAAKGAASVVGKTTRVGSKLSRAGDAALTAGRVTDPVLQATRGAGKAIGSATRAAGRVGGEALGLTTGAKYGVIREAFRNPSQEFKSALRGKITENEIVDTARNALNKVKSDRAAKYQSQLRDIKDMNKQIDISPVKETLSEKLDDFNIQRTDEGLDFSRSTISDTAEQNRIAGLIDTVEDWGSQAGDLTPAGMDVLKRRLDDFYTPSGQGRSLVNSVTDTVRKQLNDNVPGYEKMTKDYREASTLINDLENTTSLGEGKRADTALRKLTSIMRQNNEIRQGLIQELQGASGVDLTGRIAGQQLSDLQPRGLSQTLATGGLVAGIFNPKFLPFLVASSPRAVGEFVRVLGLGSDKVKSVQKALKNLKDAGVTQTVEQAGFQAGRVSDQVDQEDED